MTDREKKVVVAVVGLTAILGGVVGITMHKQGFELGKATSAQLEQDYDQRKGRIMAHVLERNPEARIRDFEGFPEALIAQSALAGMDYRLIMAVIDKESQFNPRAIGSSGEIGLMQIMPATAQLLAERLKWDWYVPPKKGAGGYADLGSLGDPKQNIRIGINFLAERVQRHGPTIGLQAYNRGDRSAREYRPQDTYARDILKKHVVLVRELPQ